MGNEVVSSEFDASVITRDNGAGGQTTNINVQIPQVQKNGLGTAGFVCALVGLFLCWVPILGWVLWLLGAIMSVVGIFRKPKGLAIAGTVISFIDIIALVVVVGGIASLGASLM